MNAEKRRLILKALMEPSLADNSTLRKGAGVHLEGGTAQRQQARKKARKAKKKSQRRNRR